MYSDLYTKPKLSLSKILIGAIIATVFSAAIFFLIQGSSPTRASKLKMIEHEVVNVTPKQFGVFWEVETTDEGYVIYGKNPSKLDSIAQDKGSNSQKRIKRKYHFVNLTNLESGTEYFYKIVSNNEILSEGGKDVFSASTLKDGVGNTGLSPIYGSVLNPSGEKAKDVFAMLIIGNAYSQIAVTGSTGEWLMPLQYIVEKDTEKLLITDENVPVSIQFFDDNKKSLVRTTLGRTRPMPQSITLGNNYSFIADENVLSAQSSNGKNEIKQQRPEIRFPKNNSVIPGTAPIIKGYGVVGETVNIEVNTRPVLTASLIVDENGEWELPVKQTIPPGNYIITIVTRDKNLRTLTISHNFSMIKSGEQVLGSSDVATPSGTLTPTSIASPSASVVITTESPIYVTVTPAPPVSGGNTIPVVLTGAGILLVGLGIFLLL